MRLVISFLLIMMTQMVEARTDYQVFVSFSMPQQLFEETALDAARHEIPLILNGFYRDSMQETAIKIFELSKKIPNLSLQIDPPAFERYGIKQVPAFVAENKKTFDVVYGNITVERAMDEIARFGDTAKDKS